MKKKKKSNKKKILIIGGILLISILLLSIGIYLFLPKEETLKVTLYDKEGKEISKTSTLVKQSIVGGVPDVKYINIQTVIWNDGDIDLYGGNIFISAPRMEFIQGFMDSYPLEGVKYTSTSCFGPRSLFGGDGIDCFKLDLKKGESFTFYSGLIDVDNIIPGDYIINVYAWGLRSDETGRIIGETEVVKSSYLLKIESDILTGSVSVFVGSKGDTIVLPEPPTEIVVSPII